MKSTGYALGVAGLLCVLGCASLPEPPVASGAYAVLRFSASMRLQSLDGHQMDSRSRAATLHVPPSRHTLRFVHMNQGVDGSSDHAGQLAAPFTLEVSEGLTYHFESKT